MPNSHTSSDTTTTTTTITSSNNDNENNTGDNELTNTFSVVAATTSSTTIDDDNSTTKQTTATSTSTTTIVSLDTNAIDFLERQMNGTTTTNNNNKELITSKTKTTNTTTTTLENTNQLSILTGSLIIEENMNYNVTTTGTTITGTVQLQTKNNEQEPSIHNQLLDYQWNDIYLGIGGNDDEATAARTTTTTRQEQQQQQQQQSYFSPTRSQNRKQCQDTIRTQQQHQQSNDTFLDGTLSTPLLIPIDNSDENDTIDNTSMNTNSPINNNDNTDNNNSNINNNSTWDYIRTIPYDIYNIRSYDELIIYIWSTVRHMGNYVAYCTLITMLMLVPLVLYNSLSNKKIMNAIINSASIMVCGTIILSMRLVYLHLTHWYMPQVQQYIVRILWMVPIYSFQSYMSLKHPTARVYITSVRDFYEAYVIANFVYYLIELLGGQEQILTILHNKDPTKYGHHAFPFCYVLDKWTLGIEFLLQCKHGVLQYVVFKTTLTIIVFICESCNVYGEGQFDWYNAYPYLSFIQNISVIYAMYCLVLFFHVVNTELQTPINWHPLGKFLCIKGVVFFTWWQGIIIFILKDHNIIQPIGQWNSNQVANGLIDYCIVIEMIGFAIAHSYTFTYTEYLPSTIQHCYTQYEQSLLLQEQVQQQQQDEEAALAEEEQQQQQQSDDQPKQNGHEQLTVNINDNNNDSPFRAPRSIPSQEVMQQLLPYTSRIRNSSTSSSDVGNNDEDISSNNNNITSSGSSSNNGNEQQNSNPNTSTTTNGTVQQSQAQQQRRLPPVTLPKPQSFKEALWSSTVPKDTIQDIRIGLRAGGVDGVIKFGNRERCSSTSSTTNGTNTNTNTNTGSSTNDLLVLLSTSSSVTNLATNGIGTTTLATVATVANNQNDRIIDDVEGQKPEVEQQLQNEQVQSTLDFSNDVFPDLLLNNNNEQEQQQQQQQLEEEQEGRIDE